MMGLARHWIKEGYLPEASWLGAKQALAYFQQWQADRAAEREQQRIDWFNATRERVRKERFLAKLRAHKIMADHGTWDAVERVGFRPALEVLEDRTDRSDIMPELGDDPYYRAAS